MKKENTCEHRIEEKLVSRLGDLKRLLAGEVSDDLGELYDYALCFDFVGVETFADQEESYFRYQISWGGPSDEFRFYTDAQRRCHRVEYWFLDWFDGAHRVLQNEQKGTALELWNWLGGMGLIENALLEAAR